MKSRILTLAAAGLLGFTASADILYWQVGDNAPTTYATAYLSAQDEGGNMYYASENQFSNGGSGEAGTPANFANGGYAGATIDASKILSWNDGETPFSGDVSTLSFFVELFDAENNWLAQTTPANVTQLKNNGQYVTSAGFNSNFTGANGTFGSGSTSYGVPEPTSGLLMLVGFGALALRRRKVA